MGPNGGFYWFLMHSEREPLESQTAFPYSKSDRGGLQWSRLALRPREGTRLLIIIYQNSILCSGINFVCYKCTRNSPESF